MPRAQAVGHWFLQTGSITGCRQRFRTAADTLARAHFTGTVFFTLCVTLISCLGPLTQTASCSQPPATPQQENQDWAPALLAREAPLEIVIIKPEGSCPEGFRSRLNFDISAQQGPDFQGVCSEASGLLVYPRFWSGSEGTDLVIETQRTCVAIAILVGNISNGPAYLDFDVRVQSPRIKNRRIPVQNKQETYILRARRTHRSVVDLAANFHFCWLMVVGRSPPPSPAELQRIDSIHSQTRAPPSFPQKMS